MRAIPDTHFDTTWHARVFIVPADADKPVAFRWHCVTLDGGAALVFSGVPLSGTQWTIQPIVFSHLGQRSLICLIACGGETDPSPPALTNRDTFLAG